LEKDEVLELLTSPEFTDCESANHLKNSIQYPIISKELEKEQKLFSQINTTHMDQITAISPSCT